MIDENDDDKSNSQEIQTESICEQISSLSIDEQISNNHSESFPLSVPMSKTWENILEKSIKAIVSIKVNRVRNFDTAKSG